MFEKRQKTLEIPENFVDISEGDLSGPKGGKVVGARHNVAAGPGSSPSRAHSEAQELVRKARNCQKTSENNVRPK